jgi:hypothetical protein
VWCGAAPDSSFLAPCCVLIVTAVAWGVASLGALELTTRRHEVVDLNAVLCIVVVSGALMGMAHAVPDVVALLLAGILAAHAALIATAIVVDAFGRDLPASATTTPFPRARARLARADFPAK